MVLAVEPLEVLAEEVAEVLHVSAAPLLELEYELLLLEDEELLPVGIRFSSSSVSADDNKSIASFILSIPVKPRGSTNKVVCT